jgi:hypothetical protein
MVAALPASFTSRFGAIVWAQGGSGYGWWPSMIYDPRYTLGATRNEARKFLGKRHLCFFFQCIESPFSILNADKIIAWEDGLARDFYLGRGNTARGGYRRSDFQRALQAAVLEAGLPAQKRIEVLLEAPGGDGQKTPLTSPVKVKRKRRRTSAKVVMQGTVRRSTAKRPAFGEPHSESQPTVSVRDPKLSGVRPLSLSLDFRIKRQRVLRNINSLLSSIPAAAAADQVDAANQVTCQIFVCKSQVESGVRRGFLFVKPDISFADLRTEIIHTQEDALLPKDWRFLHRDLGPLSVKIEAQTYVLPLIQMGSPLRENVAAVAHPGGIQVSLIDYNDL